MVQVNVGDIIPINNGRHGTRQDGKAWYIASDVKADKGADKISVFAVNADEAINWRGNKAKVKEIKSVIRKTRPYNGRYYVDTNIMAVLEEVIGYTADELEAVDDAELPFN